MSNIITLKRSNGQKHITDEGEQSVIRGQLYDAEEPNEPIMLTAIVSATLEIRDGLTGIVISSERSILNENGGTFEPDGAFKIKLDSSDNIVVDPSLNTETHTATIRYQWNDNDGDTPTGIQNWAIMVAPAQPEAEASDTSTLTVTCRTKDGTPEENIRVQCMVVDAGSGAGNALSGTVTEQTTGPDGVATFDCIRGSVVQCRRGDSQHWQKVQIRYHPTTTGPSFVGAP